MDGVGGEQLAGFTGLWLIPVYHCFRIKEDSVRVTVFLVVSVEVIVEDLKLRKQELYFANLKNSAFSCHSLLDYKFDLSTI